ncbi:MAG: T9SS type A sorting domain-containing protein [Candidatus Neomarinimicrobiota bacterium]|nr:T9SS type A sorting domain-containing protein [Candidatus Neomarinimicrobiota bacterium]
MSKNILFTSTILLSSLFATEIYFGNIDQVSGTAEILYNTDQDIGGFQFDFTGGSITSAYGGEANNSDFTISTSSNTVLGFSFTATSLTNGNSLTLINIEFTPNPNVLEFCLENIVLSDTNGLNIEYSVGTCYDVLQYDCNGELGGLAEIDECGVCGGNGVMQECGCGAPNEFGVPEGACDCDGNVVDICGDCGGTAETENDCVEGHYIYFDNLNQTDGTVDIYYASESPIGGAQFSLSGINILNASGGVAEENGWTVNTSSSTWLGFSFSNATIPSGINILTTITFQIPTDSGQLCINDPILSNLNAEALDVEIGDCLELLEYDCNGELGGLAEIDECGVCNGQGPSYDCWDGSNVCEENNCELGGLLTFGEQEDNIIPVYILSNTSIAGFQFQVDGLNILSAFGGISEESGFTLQTGNGVVLAFSFDGSLIPAGNHLLLYLEIEPLVNDEICFVENSGVLSDSEANYLNILFGDCSPILMSVDYADYYGDFNLIQVYPNPFNNQISINFQLFKSEYVNISVFNIIGDKIDTIIDNFYNLGNHTIHWNSNEIPSGIYFIKLKTSKKSQIQRITLMK